MRVVTTNNVEIFRHLGSHSFQRLGIEHKVATTAGEALELVRRELPEIAILDADLPGQSGFDLCRAIKADRALAKVRVLLVLRSIISRTELSRVEASGCDDILAPPFYGDELYRHMAQIAGLPLRRQPRVDTQLEIELPGSGQPLVGQVENLSLGGAGVKLRGVVTPGAQHVARIIHQGKPWPPVDVKVAWVKPEHEGEMSAGLSFVKLPANVLTQLEELCLFEVMPDGEGAVRVCLQGEFNERSNFQPLVDRLRAASRIVFDASSVRYISSAGVRTWCEFLSALEGKKYSFRHCSVALVLQAAMVPRAIGTGEITSLEVPYLCPACDREDLRLLDVSALARDAGHVVPPTFHCHSCGGELVFDDVPDRYFAFLRR
jgi:CheY-like chemotaxis protein